MPSYHLGQVVWLESYAENAPIKSANGTIINIDWDNRTVLVEYSHEKEKELKSFDFEELEGTWHQGYKCYMVWDVMETIAARNPPEHLT